MALNFIVAIPFETVVAVRNATNIDDAVETLAKNSEAGRVVAGNARALISAMKALPVDIIPNDVVSATASDAAPISTPATAAPVSEEAQKIQFSVRDLMMKEEQFYIKEDYTFNDLRCVYSVRTGITLTEFYFVFDGKFFDGGLDGCLKKVRLQKGHDFDFD